jgi:NitT/TauT family transport system ATP-binding protein
VLFVTHSIEEAMLIGSRILVLTPHPGRVRAELDAEGFGFDTMDRTEFGAMSKRIHRLLFEPVADPVAPAAMAGTLRQ